MSKKAKTSFQLQVDSGSQRVQLALHSPVDNLHVKAIVQQHIQAKVAKPPSTYALFFLRGAWWSARRPAPRRVVG